MQSSSGLHKVVVRKSTGRFGQRARKSFTTEWPRTKSPIHMYGMIRIGLPEGPGISGVPPARSV